MADEQREEPGREDVEPRAGVGIGPVVALSLGGAVVGAVAALLRARHARSGEAHEDGRPGLVNDLAARASAAARGTADRDDGGDDETDGEPVGVAEPAPDAAAETRDAEGASPASREDVATADAGDETGAEREEVHADDERRHDDGAAPVDEAAGDAEPRGPDEEDGAAPDAVADEAPADDESRNGAAQGRADGPAAVARAAAEQVSALTGRTPEAVLGVERRDGGWSVTLEVVELARTPSTTDVLGRYEVALDEDSELVEYRQVGRYVRGRAGDD